MNSTVRPRKSLVRIALAVLTLGLSSCNFSFTPERDNPIDAANICGGVSLEDAVIQAKSPAVSDVVLDADGLSFTVSAELRNCTGFDVEVDSLEDVESSELVKRDDVRPSVSLKTEETKASVALARVTVSGWQAGLSEKSIKFKLKGSSGRTHVVRVDLTDALAGVMPTFSAGNLTISDSTSIGINNADSKLQAGEEVALTLPLSYVGLASLSGLSATVDLGSSGATLTVAPALSVSSLSGSGSLTLTASLSVPYTVSPNLSNTVTITLTNAFGHSWTIPVSLPIREVDERYMRPFSPGVPQHDSAYTVRTISPVVTWTASQSTDLSYYEVSVGTTAGGTDLKSWTNAGNVTSYQVTGILANAGITNYVNVRAVDLYGNRSAVVSSSGWVYSSTLTVTGLSNDSTARKSKSWSWGCGGVAPCTYRFVVDTSPTTNPSGSYGSTTSTSQGSGTGTYYLHIQGTDAAGNVSSVAHYSAALDNTGPTITGLSSDSTPTKSKTWSWGCNETCTYRFTVSTSSTPSLSGSYVSTVSASQSSGSGMYYLHVQAQDSLGNVGSVTSVSAVLDNTAPTLSGLSNDTTPTRSKTWTPGCNETCTYRYAVSTSASDNPSGSYSNLSSIPTTGSYGAYYLHLQARDVAGNESSVGHFSFLLTGPIVTGLSADVSGAKSKTWAWGCSEAGCTYRFSLDTSAGGTPSGGFSSTTTTTQGAGNGTYYLHVQARSAEGHDGNVYTVSALLDNTAPTLSGIANDGVPRTSKIWSWSCSESCTYRFSVDSVETGAPSGDYSSVGSVSLSSSVSRTYYLHVQARDVAGNESGVTTVYGVMYTEFGISRIILSSDPPIPKTFRFDWSSSGLYEGGKYRIELSLTGLQSPIVIGDQLEGTTADLTIPIHLANGGVFRIYSCRSDMTGCVLGSQTGVVTLTDLNDSIGHYTPALGSSSYFGTSVAISGDGNTLVFGDPNNSSSASGINPNFNAGTSNGSGAIFIYVRSVSGWVLQVGIKASDAAAYDNFGASVAISSDGSTVAVGAPTKDHYSPCTYSFCEDFGGVYLFSRSAGGFWTQQAFLRGSDTDDRNGFGMGVSINSAGDKLVIGAPSAGISSSGKVYVFTRSGSSWSEEGNFEGGQPGSKGLAVSSDGSTVVVGISNGGFTQGSTVIRCGSAAVWRKSGSSWVKVAQLYPVSGATDDYFGGAVAIDSTGTSVVIGATGEDSGATNSGAAYVFKEVSGAWQQVAKLKADNAGSGDAFGLSVSISSAGDLVAVGAPFEQSSSFGLGGNGNINSGYFYGAVYVFSYSGSSWSQRAYVKASSDANYFGSSIALSANGGSLVGTAPAFGRGFFVY